MQQSNRGGADPITWVAIVLVVTLLGGIGAAGKKLIGIANSEDPAKAKVEAQALVEANTRAKDAEERAKQARDEVKAAEAKLSAFEKERHAAVTENIVGVVMALEQEPDPSLNVIAGLSLARSAYKSSDPITETRIAMMKETVKLLTSQNAAIRQSAFEALAAKDRQLEVERMKEKVWQQEKEAKEAARLAAELKSGQLQEQLGSKIQENKKLTDKMQTIGQQVGDLLFYCGIAAAAFFGLLWVLPLVASHFPGVGWLTSLAKGSGRIVAYGHAKLHEEETRWAEEGLRRVGEGLAAVRVHHPHVASDITNILDRHITDPEHQSLIASAARSQND